jgi:hypothetical protein
MHERGQPAGSLETCEFFDKYSVECSHPGRIAGIALRPWRPGDDDADSTG